MQIIADLTDQAVAKYKEKMAHICLECPHHPDDCPPRRCPVYTSVKLQPCTTKSAIFSMIRVAPVHRPNTGT